MPLGQIRAIVYVPIRFISNPSAVEERGWDGLDLRPAISEIGTWSDGPLDPLTQNRIPATPFNRSVYVDLPSQIRWLLGYMAISRDDLNQIDKQIVTRKYLNLIGHQIPAGIDGLYCDAVELFRFPLRITHDSKGEDLSLIALHLYANDAPTNIENVLKLARIQNKPIRLVLNSLLRTNFEGDLAVDESDFSLPNIYDKNIEAGGKSLYELKPSTSWVIVPEIERMNCIIYRSGDELERYFSGGNIEIVDDMSDQNLARFRSKMVFLGVLTNLLKSQADIFQQKWPVLLEKTDSEVIQIRSWLEGFCNAWWWKNISYDDYLQISYQKWIETLRIESVIESLRADLREFWAIRTMQKTVEAAEKSAQDLEELTRLNELAKLFAIFGIIPAWLGLFMTDLPRYVAPIASLIIVGYMLLRPKSIVKLISKIQSRIKSE
jgi:hypothetical protein